MSWAGVPRPSLTRFPQAAGRGHARAYGSPTRGEARRGGAGLGWVGADAGQGAALEQLFGWLPRGADSLGPF